MSFRNIEYLKEGSEKQVAAYKAIKKLGIMTTLEAYEVTLVGTIPIGIDVSTSDLDFICHVNHFKAFEKIVLDNYSKLDRFSHLSFKDLLTANFHYEGFEFEIYATYFDIEETNSYKHMLIEDRLLRLLGNDFKETIIELKRRGIKTEPAFAEVLGLEGNPFEAMLSLDNKTNEELVQIYLNNK